MGCILELSMSPALSQTLIDSLSLLHPQSSKSILIRKWIAGGRVTINGRAARRANAEVTPADTVAVRDQVKQHVPDWPLPVIYRDEDVLVIDKPEGLITSTGPREKRPTAIAMLRKHAAVVMPNARVGIVHRLDRDASGLLVFSLSTPALGALKKQFAERTAGRVYHAIVAGKLKQRSGTIDMSLAEYADGTVHKSVNPRYARAAITRYEVVATSGGNSQLRVTLETGRKHQIRAHLAGVGHPIVGDTLYAGPPAGRLMLAAVELAFDLPNGERRIFTIDVPESCRLA